MGQESKLQSGPIRINKPAQQPNLEEVLRKRFFHMGLPDPLSLPQIRKPSVPEPIQPPSSLLIKFLLNHPEHIEYEGGMEGALSRNMKVQRDREMAPIKMRYENPLFPKAK